MLPPLPRVLPPLPRVLPPLPRVLPLLPRVLPPLPLVLPLILPAGLPPDEEPLTPLALHCKMMPCTHHWKLVCAQIFPASFHCMDTISSQTRKLQEMD